MKGGHGGVFREEEEGRIEETWKNVALMMTRDKSETLFACGLYFTTLLLSPLCRIL